MNKEKPLDLDWTIYGNNHQEQTELPPIIGDDFGRTCEITDKELEKQLPAWVVETNRFDDDLAMASLRSALSIKRHNK